MSLFLVSSFFPSCQELFILSPNIQLFYCLPLCPQLSLRLQLVFLSPSAHDLPSSTFCFFSLVFLLLLTTYLPSLYLLISFSPFSASLTLHPIVLLSCLSLHFASSLCFPSFVNPLSSFPLSPYSFLPFLRFTDPSPHSFIFLFNHCSAFLFLYKRKGKGKESVKGKDRHGEWR